MRRASPACGLLVACAVTSACAGNTAPAGFLLAPVKAQADAYGGWIELRLGNQRNEGELLAATADSVWVLTRQGGVVIPTALVTQGKLTAYQGANSAVPGWTALGVLSTASNGLLLGITAPLWIITGTIAGSNDSRDPVRQVPPLAWADLAAFARFPQGMAGVRLEDLQPKDLKPKERP